jgi:hypothetical protein
MNGRNTSRETLQVWIYVCAGCDLLDEAERRDQVTCSPACRVRAHRSGKLRRLRALAASLEITAASILQAAAVDRLDPTVGARVLQGEVTLIEAQRLVRPAFIAMVDAAARRLGR